MRREVKRSIVKLNGSSGLCNKEPIQLLAMIESHCAGPDLECAASIRECKTDGSGARSGGLAKNPRVVEHGQIISKVLVSAEVSLQLPAPQIENAAQPRDVVGDNGEGSSRQDNASVIVKGAAHLFSTGSGHID